MFCSGNFVMSSSPSGENLLLPKGFIYTYFVSFQALLGNRVFVQQLCEVNISDGHMTFEASKNVVFTFVSFFCKNIHYATFLFQMMFVTNNDIMTYFFQITKNAEMNKMV